MVEEIPEVKFWITLNEPEIYVWGSYFQGEWPPQKRLRRLSYRILNMLYTAHSRAYDIIKNINPNSEVGIVQNRPFNDPINNRMVNKIVASTINYFPLDYYINKIKNKIDFIGLNYYFYNPINLFNEKRKKYFRSDLGWEVNEECIYHILTDLKKYNKPIYITENGLADANDIYRDEFITNTLVNVYRAISEGVNVKGYIHWALIDNFEWDKGFWPRFGLVRMDYKTGERHIRPSAYKYAEIIKNNGIVYG